MALPASTMLVNRLFPKNFYNMRSISRLRRPLGEPTTTLFGSYNNNLAQPRRYNHRQIEDFLDLKIKIENEQTIVEAEPVPTGRENRLLNVPHSKSCALCSLNLKNLDYTDVKILSQFIKRDGTLATYHESKLCSKQYLKIQRLIKKAQRCNLIKRPEDYFVPGPWHDLNTYLEPDRRRDQPMKVIKKQYWKL